MIIYMGILAIIAVVGGILLAVRTKKDENVVYGKLDKVGRITNILLIPVYICLSPLYIGLGIFSEPHYDGILGILGCIVCGIIGSAVLFCGIGIGFSVALRKRGESKLSFAVQFAGMGGIGLTVILFFLFYGNLLRPIN